MDYCNEKNRPYMYGGGLRTIGCFQLICIPSRTLY